MRKLLLTFLLVLCLAVPAQAYMSTVHTYTGLTVKISAYDTQAFFYESTIDYAQYADSGCEVTITDSSGYEIKGFIGPAMATTTLGAEIVTNGDMETAVAVLDASDHVGASSYVQSAAQAHGGTKSAVVTRTDVGNGDFYYRYRDNDNSTLTNGKLYIPDVWVYLPSGQTTTELSIRWHAGTTDTPINSIVTTDAWVNFSDYFTCETATWLEIRGELADQNEIFYIDDVSFKEVTAISGGVEIYDSPSLTTQSWKSKDAGFDYNDTSCTVQITMPGFYKR